MTVSPDGLQVYAKKQARAIGVSNYCKLCFRFEPHHHQTPDMAVRLLCVFVSLATTCCATTCVQPLVCIRTDCVGCGCGCAHGCTGRNLWVVF